MDEIAAPISSERRGATKENSPAARFLWISGICAVVLVLAIHILTIDRQAPWQDEIFVVSTGLSIARSQPPVLSVAAQYPQSDSPIKFYGPVSFEAAALQIRTFGLSVAAWRLICFAGVVATLLAACALVRLAGGDKWAQLATALILALTGSIATFQPGRLDFVTQAFFLWGLLFFLRGVEAGGKTLLWDSVVAGVLVGLSLGSTPRALPLCMSAVLATLLTAILFKKLRRNLLISSVSTLAVTLFVHTALLLPWGMNSFSWYAYARAAAKQDSVDTTAITGQGSWGFDLNLHKSFFVLVAMLFVIGALGVMARRDLYLRDLAPYDKRLPFRILLGLFAIFNMSLMLLLIARFLGQSAFWLPPMVIAEMCWFDWKSFEAKRLGCFVAPLVASCLLILLIQEAQHMTAILLSWNRMSTSSLMAFVRRTLPPGAVVYGQVSGYFYPVEIAGGHYLYLYDQSRGHRSDPNATLADKLEEEICSHPTYAMWPEPDPRQVEEDRLPEDLRNVMQPKIAEFHQPSLAPWKEAVLGRIGPVGGKYGFPDVAVYPLKSLDACGQP